MLHSTEPSCHITSAEVIVVTTSTATLPRQAREPGDTDMLLGERGADLPSLPGLPESQVGRVRVSSVSKAYLCQA